MVDEHYYVAPGWLIYNQDYYDSYPRGGTQVYLGEYASHLPGLVAYAYILEIERLGVSGLGTAPSPLGAYVAIGILDKSLFPAETFKGRENGLRKDLAEMLAAIRPLRPISSPCASMQALCRHRQQGAPRPRKARALSVRPRPADAKPISDKLIGIFFEDINYGADGGLAAAAVQIGFNTVNNPSVDRLHVSSHTAPLTCLPTVAAMRHGMLSRHGAAVAKAPWA
mgnify:CR=1 FL=1